MVFGFGRIEFDGNFIDLARPWTDFQARRPLNGSSVQAESGVEQTITKFTQWFINARLNLLDPQEKAQLQRLFEFAEDGNSFTLIRDRNFGAYINYDGGINPTAAPRGLKTNDDVDGTFTRTDVADSAWYLDEGTGLMTLRDGADVPRFPAGKYGSGLQIDGAAPNLLVNRLSNAAWTKIGMTAVTTTETLDPAGGNNADKLTATGALGNASQQSGTPVGNNVATEFWLKSSIGNVPCRLQVSGTTGTDFIPITVTPEWKPFSHSADSSGFTGNIAAVLFIVNNTDIVYSWHTPQLFDNAKFSLGTVGPLSTSSSITRNAEGLTFPSANIVNKKKISIAFWINPRWAFDGQDATSVLYRSGVSDANAHVDIIMNTNGDINLGMYRDSGSTRINVTIAGSFMTQNSFDNHILCTIDSTISNGLKIYYNGSLKVTSSNSLVNISETGTKFSIGSDLVGGASANAVLDDFLITKNILTAADVAGIFNLGIGLGVPRNRWTVKLADQTWNPRWLHSDVYDIPLLLKEVLT